MGGGSGGHSSAWHSVSGAYLMPTAPYKVWLSLSHCRDEETEAQGRLLACPRSGTRAAAARGRPALHLLLLDGVTSRAAPGLPGGPTPRSGRSRRLAGPHRIPENARRPAPPLARLPAPGPGPRSRPRRPALAQDHPGHHPPVWRLWSEPRVLLRPGRHSSLEPGRPRGRPSPKRPPGQQLCWPRRVRPLLKPWSQGRLGPRDPGGWGCSCTLGGVGASFGVTASALTELRGFWRHQVGH